MNTISLNPTYKASTHSSPWPHFMIDDLIPTEVFKKIQSELCQVETGYNKRTDDPFDLNFMFLPHMALAKFFMSSTFQKLLQQMTGHQLEIYEKSLVQLRLMNSASPAMPAHVDDQEERSLVCLWYISDWQQDCGGELNLLTSEQHSPLDSCSKVIEPKANRFVAFFSDNHHWHSVSKVQNWNRYSVISEWIVKDSK